MKKYIYTILTGGLLAIFAPSCSDLLDKAPDGKLSLEEVFADPDKVGAYLNSCYNNIPQKNLGYWFHEAFVVAMSDDAWSSSDTENQMVTQLYDGTNASANYHPLRDNHDGQGSANNQYWQRYWTQIRLCCEFLEHIDQAAVWSETDRSRFRAEAHALRAYFYSEMIKWFGRVPVIDRTYQFAEDFSELTRQPVYEVVELIKADCDAAIGCADLPWRITSNDEAPRMTKAVAHAIKSKMLLFAASPLFNEGQNRWEEAYQANKKAVEELKAHGYALYTSCSNPARYGTGPEAAYHELVTTMMEYSSNPSDKETIWQHRDGASFAWNVNYLGNGPGMFKAGACPSQELVDAYETKDGQPILNLAKPYADEKHLQPNFNAGNSLYDPKNPYENRDPRFYATVVYNGSVVEIEGKPYPVDIYAGSLFQIQPGGDKPTRTGYYHRKMVVPGSSGNVPINNATWKLFRLAEILLNYAEAAAEAGHPDEARAAVNEVRARVGMPALPDNLAGDELMLRIRNERRIELAFEEHRYFDLRRWQKPTGDLSETCKWFAAMHITKNADGSFTYERKPVRSTQRFGFENKDLLLPINLDEAARMESITGVNWQNPGW